MSQSAPTKVCSHCFEEKPRTEFSKHQPCRACAAKMWTSWSTEKRERARYAEQVQLNRLINSIPAPKVAA